MKTNCSSNLRQGSKTLAAMLLALGLTGTASAQLKDIMLKKAGDKMKKNQENNSTGNQQTNGTTTTDQNNNTSGNSNNSNNTAPAYNPFASEGSKEIRPAYTFSQNILMEMKSYNKKGELKDNATTKMRMHFGDQPYAGSEMVDEKEGQKMFMIFEPEKKQTVMLMDNNDQKIARVMKIDPDKMAAQQNKENGQKPTIVKTGRTKKVCGYTCEEWTATDEKGNKTEMWISTEVPIKSGSYYSMMSSQNKGHYAKMFGNGEMPQGFMLETTHYDTNGEKFTMTATEVNLNAVKTIDTAGYQVF